MGLDAIRLLAVFALSVVLSCGTCADEIDQSTRVDASEAPLEEISIPAHDEGLLVPVVFNGGTHLFVLDTGAPFHVLDKSLMPALGVPGIKKRAGTSGTPTEVIFYEGKHLNLFGMPSLHVGQTEVEASNGIVCVDLTAIREACDRRVMGIIGIDYFRDKIIQIDYDAQRLRIFKQQTPPSATWGEVLPLTLNAATPMPYLDNARASGLKQAFLVDTGCLYGISLSSDLFESLEKYGRLTRHREAQFTSLGQHEAATWSGHLRDFELGQSVHFNLCVREGRTNCIGLDYLRRFLTTIDISNARLFLSPAKEYDVPESEDLSGLRMLRIEDQIVVASIDEGSPAMEAGIVEGDLIQEVDGQPGNRCDLVDLRRRFRTRAGLEVRLKVFNRDGDAQKMLRLREF
jgi:hypothetical protein